VNIRKQNRRSGPARVTQAGTSKTYPHPDYGKLSRKQNRYSGDPIVREIVEKLYGDDMEDEETAE
jgi:hypothetical protein